MEPEAAETTPLETALLTWASSLGASPGRGEQALELCRLQAALSRRRRAREAADRARRLRRYLRRRRAFVLSSAAALLSLLATTRNRRVWVRRRGPEPGFWSSAKLFDEDQWKAQFRVSRATFAYLLDHVGPHIRRRATNFRRPIEPPRRLAIALWWFARAGEYRTLAGVFGVGVATACNIVRQVTRVILRRLRRRFVALPSGGRLDHVVRAFGERCCPQCGGVVGATHIPVSPLALPRDRPGDYLNAGGWHSVGLQAVVDHRARFTDVYAGWPGGTSSATVLSHSDLQVKAEELTDGYLFPKEKSVLMEGVEIPVHLIGDASFPLKPWLMKGYSLDEQLSPEQRRFTHALASARSAVDTAFMRLKGRWRCLLRRNDVDASNMSKVVVACCVLHNVCEYLGDSFLPEWNTGMAPCSGSLKQPDMEPYGGDAYCPAEVIRKTIAYNLLALLQH